jgi:hypothetical protein
MQKKRFPMTNQNKTFAEVLAEATSIVEQRTEDRSPINRADPPLTNSARINNGDLTSEQWRASDPERRRETLHLFERGLISAETALRNLGWSEDSARYESELRETRMPGVEVNGEIISSPSKGFASTLRSEMVRIR